MHKFNAKKRKFSVDVWKLRKTRPYFQKMLDIFLQKEYNKSNFHFTQ